jgi:hypothetical protein
VKIGVFSLGDLAGIILPSGTPDPAASLMKIHSDEMVRESFDIRISTLVISFMGRLIYRSVFGLLVVLFFFSRTEATPEEAVLTNHPLKSIQAGTKALASALLPVYRITLRVHLANSSRTPQEFEPVFAEINRIWLTQAGICYEIETVDHDTTLVDGLDMWFSPDIGGYNGYYDGEHIQMSDFPVLAHAADPSRSAAARTAAHELGHALNLRHRQDSDENLMRSRTYGWHLNVQEILHARETAAEIALKGTSPLDCGPPKIKP